MLVLARADKSKVLILSLIVTAVKEKKRTLVPPVLFGRN